MMGISAIPYSYKLNLGMCGMHGRYASSAAQAEADLIIAAGVRFSDRATGNTSEYTKGCTVIHIDIDASEIGKNVSSQIGLCGDIKEMLTKLLSKIPEKKNQEWLDMIEGFRARETVELNGEFTPRNIIRLINEKFSEDTVVATDVGQHQMWTIQYYRFEKPRRLLTSGGLARWASQWVPRSGMYRKREETDRAVYQRRKLRNEPDGTGDGGFSGTASGYHPDEQRRTRYGQAVADLVFRQEIFADDPAAQNGLPDACKGIRSERFCGGELKRA
jgi:hypothetical protein